MHSTRLLTFASICRRIAAALALLATVSSARAQSPLPDDFNPGADDGVSAFAVQPDGKILVGGAFGRLGGQTRNHLGRLNSDGTLDSGFNPNPGGDVNAIAIQSDERILVSGSFTYIGGQTRQYLARLNPDGSLDSGFNVAFERNLSPPAVLAMAVQPDGRILVGGWFTSIGGESRTNIARLNADGTLDATFNSSANSVVSTFAVEPGGKLLVGGGFTSIAGQPSRYLARLNTDGTLDTSFSPEPDNSVNALALQPDGKVLIAGFYFTRVGGQPRTNIARLNANGSLDDGFTANADHRATSIALEADGRILVGGRFTRIGTQTRNYLARLLPDGTLDDSFNPGADYEVWSLAVQADGKVLVGGRFGTLAGVQYRSGLGRLNTTRPATQNLSHNGSSVTWQRGGSSPEALWTTFDVSTNGLNWLRLGNGTRIQGGWEITGLNLPPSATVRARGSAVGGHADASYSVVESFCGMVAITDQPLARTNDAGTLATFSLSAIGSGPLGYLWLRDGQPLTEVGNATGTRTATLSISNVFGADAGGYSVIVTNVYGSVTSAVAILTVHDPLITGEPSSLVRTQGQSASFTVGVLGSAPLGYQWRKDGVAVTGATDSSLLLTNLQGLDAGLYDVEVTNRYGTETSVAAMLTVNVVTLDSDFNPGISGNYPYVCALAVQTDGKIIIGGRFTNVMGQARSRIARLNADGTLDIAFNPGASSYVFSLIAQADGKILVGGDFTTLGGQTRQRIGRLNTDGTVDSTFDPGASSTVYSMAMQPDGKLLVGGYFVTLGGGARERIARLHADGALDSAFNPGASGGLYQGVRSLAVQPDGKILVGGYFTTLGGQARNCIGRLNADGTVDSAFNPGANDYVYSLGVQPDGKILLGGAFVYVAGQSRNRIARLNADGSLDELFNPGAGSDVYCLALQADGKVLVGGHFFKNIGGQQRSYFTRLNADGIPDSKFDPGASLDVVSLGLQPDGRILVGGSFSKLGGVARVGIGRFNNTGPAVQNLSYDGNTVAWLRSGTSPEVWWARFQSCTNGTDWRQLDPPVRISGGWRVNGLNLPTNATFRARGFVAGGQHNGCSWVIEEHIGMPAVTMPPLSRTNNAASLATFTASAVGTQPWSHQWLREGVPLIDAGNISGARSATLNVSNVFGADAGGYSVAVSNAFGCVTSAVAMLTVRDPCIAAQPATQSREVYQDVTLSVAVSGTAPLRFQWWKDGVTLSQGTASALTLTKLTPSDAGSYYVTVSNAFGCVTSAVAVLTLQNPRITSQPISQNREVGQSATMGVTLSTTHPMDFQWYKDGARLEQGTASTLTLTNLQPADAGSYFVIATHQYGSLTSAVALLTVNTATLDTGFTPTVDNYLYGLAVQPDGKILLGGSFAKLNGVSRSRIGRLNPDGTLDTGFNLGANDRPYSFAVLPSGKILVSGTFTTLAGQTRNRIGRLNPDGTLDTAFNPGANDVVYALAVQSDEKYLFGGWFTTLGSQARVYFGRVGPDGMLDSAFNLVVDSTLYSLAPQVDGKILVGGLFSNLGGAPRSRIGRVNPDGTLDAGFAPGAEGSTTYVNALAVQPDTKILVGGLFTGMGGQPRNNLARLNADGTADNQFNPNVNGQVLTIELQTDGGILAGGLFTSVGGQPRTNLVRLNADGSVDNRFNPGADGVVYSLAIQADGKTLAAGPFSKLGGQARTWIGRLNNTSPATQALSYDGTKITWLRGGTSPEVWRTTFDVSTNGSDWISLGQGVRITGGWQLSGVRVAVGSVLRARGFATGGFYNSSTWFVESMLVVGPDLPPAIIAGDSNFGFRTNRFGFNLSAASGQAIVVEASTNLVAWTPIHTNLMGDTGLFLFRDLESGAFPRRFYRARLHAGALPAPAIRTGGPLGFQGGRFGFNVAGVIGQTVLVESSTNLQNWQPLQTNILDSDLLCFSDSSASNAPCRFYRARLMP